MPRSAYRPFPVTVAGVERLSPAFTRVTFTSDELADLARHGPDQRIKVVLPLPGQGFSTFPAGDDWFDTWRAQPAPERNPVRTYTIRHADPTKRQLVVDFVAHGDTGPASRWAAAARTGDELVVIAPDATAGPDAGGYEWRPGAATTFLLAGDETAVPAVCSIVEQLPRTARGAVLLEVPTSADVLPLAVPAGMTVTWLPRDGAHGRPCGTLLDEAVRAWVDAWDGGSRLRADGAAATVDEDPDVLWDVPGAPDADGLYAWLAGEAGAVARIRRHLVADRGLDRSRIAFMGYWRLGRAES